DLMADRADAFAALPGGFGTCEEFFEVLTWGQLGIHDKPISLLNVAGFFDPLLAWIDRSVAEGFLRPEHRRLLLVADDPSQLLDALQRYRPAVPRDRRISPGERGRAIPAASSSNLHRGSVR
ncbi:MAG: TIGR00730 family Rossman fold protein, partial [Planctomycetes bacterium]|nr:TIGR00730 family Rossman fold protein [Planctomycetota bacterium]